MEMVWSACSLLIGVCVCACMQQMSLACSSLMKTQPKDAGLTREGLWNTIISSLEWVEVHSTSTWKWHYMPIINAPITASVILNCPDMLAIIHVVCTSYVNGVHTCMSWDAHIHSIVIQRIDVILHCIALYSCVQTFFRVQTFFNSTLLCCAFRTCYSIARSSAPFVFGLWTVLSRPFWLMTVRLWLNWRVQCVPALVRSRSRWGCESKW